MITHDDLICVGCGKKPSQLSEYVALGALNGQSAEEFVMEEEGTLNTRNGHFLCDSCYIAAGQPSSPTGWVAP